MSDPSTSSFSTEALTQQYVLGNYGRFPLAFERGEGTQLWDEDGRRYLDFAAGIAVCSLGHAPACIREALAEQSARLLHVSNLYHIREQGLLARFLVETVMQRPGKVFFANSGAEANDGLVKCARKRAFDRAGGQPGAYEIVTCRQSFHGRTLGGIAATGQDKVKHGFDPLLPGFVHVPMNDVEALRAAVNERTAAILFEPVQGEGGVNTASPDFFAAAAALREQYGLLLMYDEVQCGLGRLGDWCGWRAVLQDSGISVEPDAVSWAKGIGGGYPIGAFWVSDEVAAHMGPGTHGSTYGGAPLGARVALTVLQQIEQSRAMENAARQEQRIREAVAGWQCPLVSEVRGRGLLLGFALNTEALAANSEFQASGKTPSLFIVGKNHEAGLLTVPAGENVVRWLPQLLVSDAEIDEALQVQHSVLQTIIQS